jgi:hypothetical protein
MRLTLEPTENSPIWQTRPTITIEVPGDDHNIEEMMDNLIRPLLLAFGFHPDTVYKHFEE